MVVTPCLTVNTKRLLPFPVKHHEKDVRYEMFLETARGGSKNVGHGGANLCDLGLGHQVQRHRRLLSGWNRRGPRQKLSQVEPCTWEAKF